MIESLLQKMVKVGNLTVHLPGGKSIRAGDGSGPPVVIRFTARGLRRTVMDPDLGFPESYMDEDVVFEQGTMWDMLEIVGRSGGRSGAGDGRRSWLKRTLRAVKRKIQQANSLAASRSNVHRHYDISNDLYRRFLDADMQYSCAYFARPDMTLEEAQLAKKRHLAAKLDLKPGQRVLDIGCGWGGLAMTLAAENDVQVTGITLSTEQLELARERAAAAGLSDRVRFELQDYRTMNDQFDRIVSVGMLEHVGEPYFLAFFEAVQRLLKDDGVALIHSIGRRTGPGLTHSFTQKYIFPGGYIPGVSEIVAAVEKTGMWITDIEILRLHYAETIKEWRLRFLSDPDIPRLYDGRFRRMWEFYLAGAEMGFRYAAHMNMQVQITKKLDVLPITRDYIFETEQRWDLEPPVRAVG